MDGFDTLVSGEWLEAHLGEPDLVVLDCSVVIEPGGEGGMRTVSGRPAYDSGHVPGAGFADLIDDLSDATQPIGFAVPTAEAFCAAMGRLGVGDESRVVLYDTTLSAWAARVWWMLRWVGFDRAAILDGGMRAWQADGRSLSSERVTATPQTLTPRPRPELIADRHEVLAAIGDRSTAIIDTLMAEHYRGDFAMYDRPGHIPGATNTSVMDLLDESGRYRPLAELAGLHPDDREARTITYCGGGIAASSDAFVLHRLGFTDVAVYTASLQEWAADPDNPLVTGTE